MRKFVFVGVLLVFFAATAAMGEGNRWYNNFYSEQFVNGAVETITLPWEAYRYNLVICHGTALADSVVIGFTYADGDTAVLRFKGGFTTGTVTVHPFYGPRLTTLRVKIYDTDTWVTLECWK